jgi:hypothetical protein
VFKDFPPPTSKPNIFEDGVGIEAWISPRGHLYICQSQQHEFLAERLCRDFGITDPDKYVTRHGDLLEDRGWIRLYWDKIQTFGKEHTQSQLDTLFDILTVIQDDRHWGSLANSIRSVFDMEPKYYEPIGRGRSRSLEIDDDDEVEEEENDEDEEEEEPLNVGFMEQLGGDYPASPPFDQQTTTGGDLSISKRVQPIERLSLAEEEEEEEDPVDEREYKPFILTDQPFLEITVRAYCTMEYQEDGTRRGISCFKCFCTDVTSDDKDPAPSGKHGEHIGMIGGGTGYVTLSDNRREGKPGEEFFIRHQDLWYAFQDALERFQEDSDEKIDK